MEHTTSDTPQLCACGAIPRGPGLKECYNCYCAEKKRRLVAVEFTCRRCHKRLPGTDRYRHFSTCVPCYSAKEKAQKYDTTPEYLEQLYAEQGGLCRICDQPQTFTQINVDHDKVTGFIRGLLCMKCNLGIGLGQHDENILGSIAGGLNAKNSNMSLVQ